MVDLRWSAGETVALIEAWRPLYDRRRGGESDVWVPASQRSRARSTRGLATEDWRAVATAVNSFRTEINLNPNRTHKQCKRRVERLKCRFGDEQLATPSWDGFVPVVRNNTAGGREHSRLRVLATAAAEAHGGDECGGGAAGRQACGGPVVAEGGSAEAEGNGGSVMGVGAAAANATDVTAVEGDGATAQEEALRRGPRSDDPPSGPVDGFTAAATDFFGPPIPKKRRTGASTSTSTSAGGAGDGRAPSVKEELVREAKARRARVDEGRAPACGFAATAPEIAAALAEVFAAESNEVAVMTKLSDMFKEATTMYREVAMERIELQRQMLAALAATTGGAAVPQPDAART